MKPASQPAREADDHGPVAQGLAGVDQPHLVRLAGLDGEAVGPPQHTRTTQFRRRTIRLADPEITERVEHDDRTAGHVRHANQQIRVAADFHIERHCAVQEVRESRRVVSQPGCEIEAVGRAGHPDDARNPAPVLEYSHGPVVVHRCEIGKASDAIEVGSAGSLRPDVNDRKRLRAQSGAIDDHVARGTERTPPGGVRVFAQQTFERPTQEPPRFPGRRSRPRAAH